MTVLFRFLFHFFNNYSNIIIADENVPFVDQLRTRDIMNIVIPCTNYS